MPAMRKNVSPSTLFYFPSQVRIHPQIRSQITRLQSKYSLDLDPHSGVTQPKLSRATQTFTSVKAKQYTPVCSKHPRACKPQHRNPLSLWRFHYLLSPTAAMSLNLASPNTPPLALNPPRQGAAGDSTPQGPTMCSKFCPLAARRGCRSFHIDFLPAASQPPSKPPPAQQEPERRAMTTCTYSSSPNRQRHNKCVNFFLTLFGKNLLRRVSGGKRR